MTSPWHQALFSTRLANPRASLQELTTTAGGFRLATSVGGVLTGRGADLIVIDDPLKPDEAMSETQRRNVNEWFDGTLYSRLNDKAGGVIVIIMQRLHEDDLVGHVLSQEGWKVLSFPAIAEVEEIHVVETIFGQRVYRRSVGEALHPAWELLETLDEHPRDDREPTISPANISNRPRPRAAAWSRGMVPALRPRCARSNLRTGHSELGHCQQTLRTCGLLGLHQLGPQGRPLLSPQRVPKKLAYPDLKRAVREQHRLFNAATVLIEDKASGTQLIQELVEDGLSRRGVKADGDKIMRCTRKPRRSRTASSICRPKPPGSPITSTS